MKVQNLRGTRDFYPDKMFVLNYITNVWKKVAKKYAYLEFDGPMLEPALLWKMKSGAEIPDQMYAFKDKSDNEIAVRPELTPTLARMVAAKQRELPKPIRWFSVPRCWRYAAPQSGRLREFFQLNFDLLGSDSMKADAEIIMTAIDIMREFGCTKDDFYIRLGNRKLIQALLISIGIKPEQLQDVGRLIDKKDKMKSGDFEKALSEMGFEAEVIEKLDQLLATNDLDSIDEKSIGEEGKLGLKELKELVEAINSYGAMDFVEVDFSIMRGFDYYTSTVFEVFDRSRKFRAIAGGGRYCNLVEDFGGEKCPGVGYGMGDVVMELFLKDLGKIPNYDRGVDYYVVSVNDSVSAEATKIAVKLRKQNSVELDISGRQLRKAFDYANNIGAKKIVIVGPKDLAEGKVTIRDLASGEEQKVDVETI